jgi:Asp-tRNA(Asn)/Glu-tRNA(Gln) amidotransferase A subunit family amidase
MRLDAGDRAPLLGVPIATKDTVDIAGELTTHGTGAVTRPAGADAEVVRRLRRAGVVIIGQAMVRVGRFLHGWPLTRARAQEPQIAARINTVFDNHDVLLTPVIAAAPPAAGRWRGKGFIRTLLGGMPYIAYTAVWNCTGQPAALIPVGFDDEGLPLAVQLVGRPNDEATLISLAAQVEATRPWTDRRPASCG